MRVLTPGIHIIAIAIAIADATFIANATFIAISITIDIERKWESSLHVLTSLPFLSPLPLQHFFAIATFIAISITIDIENNWHWEKVRVLTPGGNHRHYNCHSL